MPALEEHYIDRSNWLRAAVLGANDGILSTASLAVGVAAAATDRHTLLLATLAGLVAGAFSMAAGEFVSVSSQADLEAADLQRELDELRDSPEGELAELAEIYVKRGLDAELALAVAIQLTDHDALLAHARDELGIQDLTAAKPLQAALASGVSFLGGGFLPVLLSALGPLHSMVALQYVVAIATLILLGIVSARVGGTRALPAVIKVTLWGTLAMAASAGVGYLFGVQVG